MLAVLALSQTNCGSLEPDVSLGTYFEGFDPNAPAWTPEELPGLSLWLDAAQGTDSTVDGLQRWYDLSEHHNNAVPVTPKGVAPVVVENALGGRPAIHLDGTNYLRIEDAESLQFGEGDFLVALAARHTTPTTGPWGYGLWYSKQESTNPFWGPCLIANTIARTTQLEMQVSYRIASVITPESDLNADKPMVLVMHRQGVDDQTKLEVRLNGVSSLANQGSLFAVDVSALKKPVHIGGTPAKQNVFGDFAEVIAVKGTVSNKDVHALEGYLLKKYGL